MPIENRPISTMGFPKLDLLLYRKFFICLDSLSGGAQVFCQRMHFFFRGVHFLGILQLMDRLSVICCVRTEKGLVSQRKQTSSHLEYKLCKEKHYNIPLKFKTIGTLEEWLLTACSECWQWQN